MDEKSPGRESSRFSSQGMTVNLPALVKSILPFRFLGAIFS